MEQRYRPWIQRCEAALRACKARGGKVEDLVAGAPATESQVLEVEQQLGLRLPSSFRTVLTGFAASFKISWQLPDEPVPPGALREVFHGELGWDLAMLPRLDAERRRWIELVFPDPADRYDRVWHEKIAFWQGWNDDLVALEPLTDGDAAVVYLSHDDGRGHGYHLGPSFEETIDRWTLLGCVGAEDLCWLPFVSSPTSGLEPYCHNAVAWRTWFGLDV